MEHVPEHLSRRMAAILTGHSRLAIDVLVESGVLRDERRGRWSQIPTAQVEELRHAPTTAADYLQARAQAAEARRPA